MSFLLPICIHCCFLSRSLILQRWNWPPGANSVAANRRAGEIPEDAGLWVAQHSVWVMNELLAVAICELSSRTAGLEDDAETCQGGTINQRKPSRGKEVMWLPPPDTKLEICVRHKDYAELLLVWMYNQYILQKKNYFCSRSNELALSGGNASMKYKDFPLPDLVLNSNPSKPQCADL